MGVVRAPCGETGAGVDHRNAGGSAGACEDVSVTRKRSRHIVLNVAQGFVNESFAETCYETDDKKTTERVFLLQE